MIKKIKNIIGFLIGFIVTYVGIAYINLWEWNIFNWSILQNIILLYITFSFGYFYYSICTAEEEINEY